MSDVFASVCYGWNHPQSPPVINGDAARTREEIVSFTCGGTTVARNSASEPIYLGDAFATSFVSRMIDAAGTAQAWTANYS